MFCYRCGQEIPDNKSFCPECGARQKNQISHSATKQFCTCEECRKREFFKKPPTTGVKALKIVAAILIILSVILSVLIAAFSVKEVYSFEEIAEDLCKEEPVVKKAFASPESLSDAEKEELSALVGVDINEIKEIIESVNKENYAESLVLIADEGMKVVVKIMPVVMSASDDFRAAVDIVKYAVTALLLMTSVLCILIAVSAFEALRRNRIGKSITIIILSLFLTVASLGVAAPMLAISLLLFIVVIIHRIQYKKYMKI